MSSFVVADLLAPAVTEVLETMFFSETLGSPEPDAPATELEAEVAFTGELSGTVRVRISPGSAQNLAASFLGESEHTLTEDQIANVVFELANMICGCILSKIASHGCFDLAPPRFCHLRTTTQMDTVRVQGSFAIERGTLSVSLTCV